MLLTQAKSIIENAGIKVTEVEMLKGSCKTQGLSIGEGTVRPTIYAPTVADMNESELIRFAKESMDHAPEIDIPTALTREFIMEHCFSCIRHATDDEETIKWSVFGDLEEYIRIDLDTSIQNSHMTVVVTKAILNMADVSADELRVRARRNLKEKVKIAEMTDVLQEMMDQPIDSLDVFPADRFMYVATNESNLYGASAMLLDDILQEFCEKHGLNAVFIIPSSIHEVLLISADNDPETINAMISDVNRMEVDEWDQLSNHCYVFKSV